MGSDDRSVENLRRRQRDEERAEREQLADATEPAEAERHRRRADKARYLRHKLEERQRAERELNDDPDLPPAA